MNNILPRVTDNNISIQLGVRDVRIAGAHAGVLAALGALGVAVGAWTDMGGWHMATLFGGAEGTIVREGTSTTALLIGVG